MFSYLLITHRIVVTFFLLHYVIKTALLLLDKKEPLASYTKATRIAEMVLSFLFLITGVWMMAYSAITTLLIVKILCVLAAIPLAIVGFKKGNKALAALAIILILAAYGLAEVNKKHMAAGKIDTSTATDALAAGKQVYEGSCINCHGADGKLGLAGAKDLSQTMLGIDAQKDVIMNGKNAMPANKNLTPGQLEAVVEYIGTLKK